MKFFHKILLVMLGVGLLPMGLMAWKTLTLMQERLLGEALVAREVRARSITGEIQIFFENLERKLNGFVFNRNIENLNVESLQSVCDLVLAQNPEIEIMTILDESGQERLGRSRQQVSGYSDKVSPQVLLAHLRVLTPELLQLARERGMALGPIDLQSKIPSATMVIPYPTNNSDWYGLIAVRFQLKRIQQILSGGDPELEKVNVLSFLLGELDASPVFGPFEHSRSMLDAYLPIKTDLEKLLKQNGKAGVIQARSGKALIALAQPLENLGWSLYSFEVSDHALASAIFLRNMVFFLFGIILLLVLIMAFAFAAQLVRPIRVIEKAAREYAEGRFGYRFPVKGKDEIADLGHRFQGMAEQISQFLGKEVDNARMEAELKVAQAVQKTLITEQFPDIPGVDIHGYYQPSSEAGGDWYGVVHVPDEKAYLFILGDVTGHGAGAALVTSAANTFFRALEQWITLPGVSTEPDQVLKDLNQVLYRSTKGGMAMTMFVYKYFPESGRLVYSNAGQSTPFHWVSPGVGSKPLSPLNMRGTPLGYAEDSKYKKAETVVNPGDYVLMYSDGIIECENPKGEDYGKKRLKKFLERYNGENCKTFLKNMTEEAFAFYEGVHPDDDITMLMLRLMPSKQKEDVPQELRHLLNNPKFLLHLLSENNTLPKNLEPHTRHLVLGDGIKIKDIIPGLPDDPPAGLALLQRDEEGLAPELLRMTASMFEEGLGKDWEGHREHRLTSSQGWQELAPFLIEEDRDLLPSRTQDHIIFVMTEILMNALYDAPVDEAGDRPFMTRSRDDVFELPEDKPILVRCHSTDNTFSFQVEDAYGSLKTESVIRYLKKSLIKNDDQMDKKEGGAGLGVFLCWKRSAALFFDVTPGEKTVVTATFWNKAGRLCKERKALGINVRGMG